MRARSIAIAIALSVVSSLATWQLATAQDAASADLLQRDIKTGGDIGFRVDYMERNKAMGRLVVRVNGRWVDAEFSMRITPLSTP